MKASLSITRRPPSPPPVAAAWQPPPSRSRTSPLSAAANAPLSPKLFPSTTSMGSPLLTTPTTTHSWAPDETSGVELDLDRLIYIIYIYIHTSTYISYILYTISQPSMLYLVAGAEPHTSGKSDLDTGHKN